MREANTLRILRLTLTRKWFVMILRGIKREEYREIKPYWCRRLMLVWLWDVTLNKLSRPPKVEKFQDFDFVEFRNGYATDAPTMLVECKGLAFGTGRPEWGGDDTEKFVISLGKIISTQNTEQLLSA